MSRYLVDQIERSRMIEALRHTEVRELAGEQGVLRELVVEDTCSGDRRTIPARALFVFIGADPCTGWLHGRLALDSKGFVLAGPPAAGDGRQPTLLETSRPGVLAVGDVRSGSVKRMASAVGEGAIAARLAYHHLERHGLIGP
jgi:thioredoxin reductase (NADPH)